MQVFVEGSVPASVTADGEPEPHHWTGSLLNDAKPATEEETPASVLCSGDGVACAECGTNPPCGGTIKPATQGQKKHIFVRADAVIASAGEISFTKSSPHLIAILEPDKDVPAQLDAWHKKRAKRAAVYHIYHIAEASQLEIKGKLIAIPVPPLPGPTTSAK